MKNFFLGIYLMIWGCILGMAGSINLAGDITAGIVIGVGILLMVYKEKKKKPFLTDFKRMCKSPDEHIQKYWDDPCYRRTKSD